MSVLCNIELDLGIVVAVLGATFLRHREPEVEAQHRYCLHRAHCYHIIYMSTEE